MDDSSTPDRFSADGWRQLGFGGFTPLLALDRSQVPNAPGVYVVLRPTDAPPVFDAVSSGGWFKGRDPSVSSSMLAANWVDSTHTIYIGKAGTSLAQRLIAYRNFGQGRAVGHWGGRLVWHLADRSDLLACWTTTAPDVDPGQEESRLIDAFRKRLGTRPFANLRD